MNGRTARLLRKLARTTGEPKVPKTIAKNAQGQVTQKLSKHRHKKTRVYNIWRKTPQNERGAMRLAMIARLVDKGVA